MRLQNVYFCIFGKHQAIITGQDWVDRCDCFAQSRKVENSTMRIWNKLKMEDCGLSWAGHPTDTLRPSHRLGLFGDNRLSLCLCLYVNSSIVSASPGSRWLWADGCDGWTRDLWPIRRRCKSSPMLLCLLCLVTVLPEETSCWPFNSCT